MYITHPKELESFKKDCSGVRFKKVEDLYKPGTLIRCMKGPIVSITDEAKMIEAKVFCINKDDLLLYVNSFIVINKDYTKADPILNGNEINDLKHFWEIQETLETLRMETTLFHRFVYKEQVIRILGNALDTRECFCHAQRHRPKI